ncbi:MAG: hypothetical protein AAGD09_03615 [Cyanobacteria bacterium P01_F01_bin.56]
MPVNATARRITTTIGGQDWSSYIVDFQPIRAGLERDGILSKSGTITIAYDSGNPSSLDPLLNAAIWHRGTLIGMTVANDAGVQIVHPYNNLFITNIPTLNPAETLLTVDVGDWLALANKSEVPGDDSGVTVGTAVDLSVICQRYLERAGIPTANIALGGPWGYSKAIPLPKDGVNALAMAGRIAYAAAFRVLYCDPSGIVRSQLTTVTPGTPLLTYNLDNKEIPREWYERSFEPGTAAEIVKVVATGETVSTISTPITDTQNESDLDVFTSSSYDLEEETLSLAFGNIAITIDGTPQRVASRIERRRERQSEDIVFGNGNSTLVVTDDTFDQHYYQALPGNDDGVFPYRLFFRIARSEKAVGLINGGESSTTESYRLVIEQWAFDDDGVMTTHVVSTYARQKQYEPDGLFGLQWRVVERLTETWEEESAGAYRYTTVSQAAAITSNRSLNAQNAQNKWALRTTNTDSSPATDQGDNTPPAATLWEGPYSIDPTTYEGEATYTPPGGASPAPPERVISISEGLGISDAVCQEIAAKEAAIGGGREFERLLSFPISNALLAIDIPLWKVAYIDGGITRTYLVDLQAFNHTSDELVCSGAGILIDEALVVTIIAGNAVIADDHPAGDEQITLLADETIAIADDHAAGDESITLLEVLSTTISDDHAAGDEQITAAAGETLVAADDHSAGDEEISLLIAGTLTVADDHAVGDEVVSISTYDTDAQAFIDLLSGTYTSAQLDAINDFVVSNKANGIWAKLDLVWLLAANNTADSATDMTGNGFSFTNNGMTFTASQGYQGNASSAYLLTDYNPDTDGINYTQNSASIGIYSRTNNTTDAVDFGVRGPNHRVFIQAYETAQGVDISVAINQDSSEVFGTPATDGCLVLARTASNDARYYRNGTQVGSTITTASTGVADANLEVGVYNNNGTRQEYSDREYALAFAGGGLTSSEVTDLSASIETFLDAFGAGVIS